jgi:hypothetical protein
VGLESIVFALAESDPHAIGLEEHRALDRIDAWPIEDRFLCVFVWDLF